MNSKREEITAIECHQQIKQMTTTEQNLRSLVRCAAILTAALSDLVTLAEHYVL